MSEPTDVSVVEIDDDAWDDFCIDADPHEGRSYLRGVVAAQGSRAVLVAVTGSTWKSSYALVLTPLEGQRWLARTPDYGGPWLRGPDLLQAASKTRERLDEVLRSLDVVSEVFILSPWLPGRDEIARTWATTSEKRICTASLRHLGELHRSLRKGRRADIARGRRDLHLQFVPLNTGRAEEFAEEYAVAMERLGASDRWRFGTDYFTALVDAGAELFESRASGEAGGASAIFLMHGQRASYLFATRFGDYPGAASAALWCGMEALADRGVNDLNLGGGVSADEDDPLLRFKRSMSSETLDLQLGARCFDRLHHDAAVACGVARPLPDAAVFA